MSRFPARTVALFGVSAVTVLAASGCGSGDDAHDAHSAGTPTTITTGTAGDAAAAPSADAAAPSSEAAAVDRAFVAQMIPHHEMAVAMAADTRERGEHAEIRALGTGITKAQEREIAELRTIAKRLGVAPASMADDAAPSGHEGTDHGGGGTATSDGGTDHSAMGHGSDDAPDATTDDTKTTPPAEDSGSTTGGSMAADAKSLGLSMDEMGMSMDMSALKTAKPFDRAFIDQMIPHHQGAIRMARAQLAHGRDPELRRISKAIVAAQKREIAEMNDWRERWYGAASPAGGVPAA